MRIETNGQRGWLGYCANVHPGESLRSVLHAIEHFGRGVRRELGVDRLALGLWLSRAALTELEHVGTAPLMAALAEAGIAVVSLNGFPFGDFHAEVVKRAVYHPDLGSDRRREYLLGLAGVLAAVMPADVEEGTISTLPLGHREEALDGSAADGGGVVERALAAERAALQLCRLAVELARLRDRTGRAIRICLEPEPGCWLESTRDAIEFFTERLPKSAEQLGTPSGLLRDHLGVCYDTCHQAIVFEDAARSIEALHGAGIRIGKAQLSSAIEIVDPGDPAAREELMRFAEPRFLHQVRTLAADGGVLGVDDLPAAMTLPTDRPFRVHFHVPIHRARIGRLTTTRPFLESALASLAKLPELPHLEVETYTWSVLPERERPTSDRELMRGLADELRWAEGALP
ncbi:MAG TPA: metabolite traffic protein EboE [Polyangiales bacterium]|nr:metabolite traffic protein EboE [Polyangiales bacterium]